MNHIPTEDITGDIDAFALEDEPTSDFRDEDKQIIDDDLIAAITDYLDEQIALHNSFDAIEPGGEGVMTTQQQVQMNKIVVAHLRQVKQIIKDKVEEQ